MQDQWPEYLAPPHVAGAEQYELFHVRVKIDGRFGVIADHQLPLATVLALLTKTDASHELATDLHTVLCFDDHPFAIKKYEFKPAKRQLIIHAERYQA